MLKTTPNPNIKYGGMNKRARTSSSGRQDRAIDPYIHRESNLATIGFISYKDYLESDLWKEIREKVFAKHSRCFGCGKPANQVHHRDYSVETLSGNRLFRLRAICTNCHEHCEIDENGHKIKDMKVVENRLNRLHNEAIKAGIIPRSKRGKKAIAKERKPEPSYESKLEELQGEFPNLSLELLQQIANGFSSKHMRTVAKFYIEAQSGKLSRNRVDKMLNMGLKKLGISLNKLEKNRRGKQRKQIVKRIATLNTKNVILVRKLSNSRGSIFKCNCGRKTRITNEQLLDNSKSTCNRCEGNNSP